MLTSERIALGVRHMEHDIWPSHSNYNVGLAASFGMNRTQAHMHIEDLEARECKKKK